MIGGVSSRVEADLFVIFGSGLSINWQMELL
jgi:hypothetical protein